MPVYRYGHGSNILIIDKLQRCYHENNIFLSIFKFCATRSIQKETVVLTSDAKCGNGNYTRN